MEELVTNVRSLWSLLGCWIFILENLVTNLFGHLVTDFLESLVTDLPEQLVTNVMSLWSLPGEFC